MFGKTMAALGSLAVVVSVGLAGSGAASASSAAQAPASPDRQWCQAKGGKAEDHSPWYNANSSNPTPLGGRFLMCTFTDPKDHTAITVAADTLAADKPTLAALAYTFKPAAKDEPGGGNPSSQYCQQLGGTSQFGDNPLIVGGWAPSSSHDPADIFGMCVFGDRSMIDEWGLYYHTAGVIRGSDLKGKWKASMPTKDVWKASTPTK